MSLFDQPLYSFTSVPMAIAICWDSFHGLCCLWFSRSIEVYVPPDLLQIGIIITHKKSITTLVWHHGYGEVSTEANSTGTLPTSTVCCPASHRLHHSSCAIRIRVSQFALLFMASQSSPCLSPDILRHGTKLRISLFTYLASHIALHISYFTYRTSHTAFMFHFTFTCLSSLCERNVKGNTRPKWAKHAARQARAKHEENTSLKCEMRTWNARCEC